MQKNKLVFGVGINDAEYLTAKVVRINGKQTALWRCDFYRVWTDMLRRCYSASRQLKQPTYTGCTVYPEWHTFSKFRAWMLEQPWKGGCLDKDILKPGNKIYSPDSCVFVSQALNNFLTDRGVARGEWPIGVSLAVPRGKFMAQCRDPFRNKSETLGYFSSPDTAHEAWRRRKHQHACRYADQQEDQRIAAALRNRFDIVVGCDNNCSTVNQQQEQDHDSNHDHP